VALVDQGESPATVARILGVHETSLHRWRRLAKAGDLAATPHPGPKPRLADDQLRRLEQLLLQGAKQHGWPNDLWTADRVATLIRRHFHLRLHPEHVRRMLKRRLG
jgi:transposase